MTDDSPIDSYLAGLPADQREVLQPLTDSFLAEHEDELSEYRRTKGSLHFTPEAPLTEPLVGEIVRARLADLRAGTDSATSLDPDDGRD